MKPRTPVRGATAKREVVALGLAFLVSCSGSRSDKSAPVETVAKLAEGVVAQVGSEPIEVETVLRIAAAQHLSPEQARSKAISDALFAQGAKASGLQQRPDAVVAVRGILARALIKSLQRQTSAEPITQDEIKQFSDQHWLDLDRPVARRSAHALVPVEKDADEPRRAQAFQLATQIQQAVQGVTSADQFEQKAQAVPSQGFKVRVEQLPPVTEDGRVALIERRDLWDDRISKFDLDFTAGLYRLAKPGEISAPVLTPFGYHVILFVELQPGKVVPFDQREPILRSDILGARAKKLLEPLTQQLRQSSPIQVERNADTLLGTELGPASSGER